MGLQSKGEFFPLVFGPNLNWRPGFPFDNSPPSSRTSATYAPSCFRPGDMLRNQVQKLIRDLELHLIEDLQPHFITQAVWPPFFIGLYAFRCPFD
jgi:hypothetical protein